MKTLKRALFIGVLVATGIPEAEPNDKITWNDVKPYLSKIDTKDAEEGMNSDLAYFARQYKIEKAVLMTALNYASTCDAQRLSLLYREHGDKLGKTQMSNISSRLVEAEKEYKPLLLDSAAQNVENGNQCVGDTYVNVEDFMGGCQAAKFVTKYKDSPAIQVFEKPLLANNGGAGHRPSGRMSDGRPPGSSEGFSGLGQSLPTQAKPAHQD